MSQSIKILTFERQELQEEQKQPLRGDAVLNIVLYNRVPKSLTNIERKIKGQYLEHINLVKCNKLTNLNYALNTCKQSIKTICIADEQISSEAVSIIMKNQTVMNNIDNFKLCFFIPEVQSMEKINFHAKSVVLITSEEEKIIEYVSSKIENSMRLKPAQSTSTINSDDRLFLQQKFLARRGTLQNLESERTNQKIDINYNNGIPGVGEYKIEGNLSNESHKFGNSPNRSNPNNWMKTDKTFGRMEN